MSELSNQQAPCTCVEKKTPQPHYLLHGEAIKPRQLEVALPFMGKQIVLTLRREAFSPFFQP